MSRAPLLILLLLPAACAPPVVPRGPWSGAPEPNDWNLRATVANPHDFWHGEAATGSLGAEAAPPVRRLFAGQRTQLPEISAEQVYPTANAPQAQGTSGGGQ